MSLAERTCVDKDKSSKEGRNVSTLGLIFSGITVFPSVRLLTWIGCYLIFIPRYLCLSGRWEKGDEELEKRTTVVFPCCRIEHLGLNVVLQLLVGVPLEMVHGAARISFVYVAGVVAGRWHLSQTEKQWKLSVLAFELEKYFCDIVIRRGAFTDLLCIKILLRLDIENIVQLDIYFYVAIGSVFKTPAKNAPATCYFKIALL